MNSTAEPTIAAAALVARRPAARRIAPGLALLAALAALPARPLEAASDPYRRLHPYVGDIHVHSGLALYRVLDPNAPHSLGDADEILDAAAIRGLDFVAITDHTNNLDDPRGLAWRKEHGAEFTLPDGKRTASEFAFVQSQIARLNRPGRFVTILGLEYTRGTTENAAPGHQLGLFPGDSLPRYCSNFPQNVGDCLTVRDFYAFVAEMKGIAVMAHPCVTWGPSDWSEIDPVLNSMELTAGKCEFGKSGYN
jgi:hypothetical protein